MSMQALFLILAIICFVLSAFGVDTPRVGLLALGLAFFAASFLAVSGVLTG